jgi:hypothetical protein
MVSSLVKQGSFDAMAIAQLRFGAADDENRKYPAFHI